MNTETRRKGIVKLEELPKELYLEPTNRCNSRCQTCVRTFHRDEAPRDLTFEEFRSIVDQFPRLDRVVLHGIGEPLLNKDLPKMIRHLKSRGTHVLFNTNATLLDEHIGSNFIESGLDEIRVSLDAATPETYIRIRGIDLFDQVTENIKAFVDLKENLGKRDPMISLWFVGSKENIEELPDLIRLAEDLGVGEVHLQRLTFFGENRTAGLARAEHGFYQNPEQSSADILREADRLARSLGIKFSSSGATTPLKLIENREKSVSPWENCYRPWKLTYINANGNVLPCCISPFSTRRYEDIVMGNIFKEGLIHIWNNPSYAALRRSLQSPDPPSFCQGCGVKWSL